jgi:hypothetical protein
VLRTLDRVERAAVARAAARLTVTGSLAQLLHARFGREFAVVRNLHDSRLDDPAAASVRTRLGLGDDVFLLVVAGNAKHAGAATSEGFAALQLLPDNVHFACIGRRWDDFADEVARLGVSDRVHLLPAVPPTAIAGLIAGADLAPILYYPNARDFTVALPNRLTHAIAAGLPVLFPPGLPEIRAVCERYSVGLPVDTRDPAAIAGRVEELLANPGLLRSLSENARRASAELRWEGEEPALARLLSGTDRGA